MLSHTTSQVVDSLPHPDFLQSFTLTLDPLKSGNQTPNPRVLGWGWTMTVDEPSINWMKCGDVG